MTFTAAPVEVSCAVEVFIAAALLHKEQLGRPGFTIQEIIGRAEKENICGELRPGVSVHASQHCVANKAPNPGKHRMLFATGKHTRRLLLPGDEVHPERTGKIFPEPEEVPEKYLALLDWAKHRYTEVLKMTAGRPLSPLPQPPLTPPPGPVLPEPRPLTPPPSRASVDNPDDGRSPLYALLEARGIGVEMAKGIDPDDYIRELREGWE